MTEGLDNSVCVGLLYSKDWRRAKQQRQSTETQMGVGSAKALLEVRGREIEGNAVSEVFLWRRSGPWMLRDETAMFGLLKVHLKY